MKGSRSQLEDPAGASGRPVIRRPLGLNCLNRLNRSALDNGERDEYYPFMLPRVIQRCGIFLLAFAFLLSLNSFASEADLKPAKIGGTMAFMVESCWPYVPS